MDGPGGGGADAATDQPAITPSDARDQAAEMAIDRGGPPEGGMGVDRGGTADSSAALCADRRGGALIDFRICGSPLRLWITNGGFIDQAKRLASASDWDIACFNLVKDGRDCDSMWTWHVDAQNVYWTSQIELETYDGCPQQVEDNKDDWVEQIGKYCAFMGTVVSVADRR
jgi:hypothetical protein